MFLRALAAAAVILVSAIPAMAGLSAEACVNRESARQILSDQGQEIVVAGNLGGAVMSVAVNPETGEWTLMFTNNDAPDTVCVAAMGIDWISVTPLPGEDA